MDCSKSGSSLLHYFPEFVQIHEFQVNSAIQPSHPLSSPSHALMLSRHLSIFEWIGSLHQVAKVLDLQLHYQSNEYWTSNEYSGLISFSIDWFDLLVSKELFTSTLSQYHSLKASVPWPSAFFMVQLSYSYMATGKTITLTIWTFVDKVLYIYIHICIYIYINSSILAWEILWTEEAVGYTLLLSQWVTHDWVIKPPLLTHT